MDSCVGHQESFPLALNSENMTVCLNEESMLCTDKNLSAKETRSILRAILYMCCTQDLKLDMIIEVPYDYVCQFKWFSE